MKKIMICTLLVILAMGVGTVCYGAQSGFGSGAAVIAEDVEMVKTGIVGERLSFGDGDFKSALCIPNFERITVTRVPSSAEGTLFLNGRRVSDGTVIERRHIGGLCFIPASDSVRECSFAFKVEGRGAGAEFDCRMKFIGGLNLPPVAEESNKSVKTQREVGVYGSMSAVDPEGDEIEYIVVSYPKYGILTMTDGDGGYRYTPVEGYTGDDRFVYVAMDEYGNYSYPAEVRLRVTERMSEAVYRDMQTRPEYNAALAMTAMNVMNGRIIGDGVYFMPDEGVSRAEFLAMALKCAGIDAAEDGAATFFDDDGDIPDALRPYVVAAQRRGLINGEYADGKLCFCPNRAVTKYEAAGLMAAVMGIDTEGEDGEFELEVSAPVWARGDVCAMYTLGIFDTSEDRDATAEVARADAAGYLYRMMSREKTAP